MDASDSTVRDNTVSSYTVGDNSFNGNQIKVSVSSVNGNAASGSMSKGGDTDSRGSVGDNTARADIANRHHPIATTVTELSVTPTSDLVKSLTSNGNESRGWSTPTSITRTLDVLTDWSKKPPLRPMMAVISGMSRDCAAFEAFFVHHHNQRDWVFGLMERLEAPSVGLRCLSIEQDQDRGTANPRACSVNKNLYSKIYDGIRRSRKTLMVLSPEFLSDIWINVSDMKLLTSRPEVDVVQRNLIVLMFHRCDIPDALFDVTYIDVESDDWWQKLLSHLRRSDDTPQTELTTLSNCCSPDENDVISLHNGRLLTSLRSRCKCCGQELIDASDLPNEFLVCGVQIPAEEYTTVIDHLMSDGDFVCHVWCYNVPGAVVVFTVLLCLCLTVIPAAEVRLMRRRSHTGLEFVHAVVVWLCCLAIYMVVMHISKRKMKKSSYKRLTHVNRCLIKYNLLAGIENLGLADCNKYYLHFFYYDVGPCLAYLQELIVKHDDYASGAGALGQNEIGGHQLDGQLDGQMDSFVVEMETRDEQLSMKNDCRQVLNDTVMTNASLQIKTEELIIQHSGQYIGLLISKKLERPRKSRHILDRPCLCQYIEQHVCRLIV